MRKLVVLMVAVTVLGVSGLAMAQGWGGGGRVHCPCGGDWGPAWGPGYGPGGPGYGSGAGLNLSPEQTQKLQALRENFFKETLPLRNELALKHLELRTLWSQPNPNQNQILAKQKEINALREQLQERATRHRLEVGNTLTPEQQAQALRNFPGGFGSGGPGRGMRCGYGLGRRIGMGFVPGPCW